MDIQSLVDNSYRNLSVPELYEHALRREEGIIAFGGPLAVRTNKTGRSPKDRFIVEDEVSKDKVWWEGFNKPISEEVFQKLYTKMLDYAADKKLFIQDLFAGTDKNERLSVQFIQEMSYHSIFVRNMFVRPTKEELLNFKVDWTVINIPSFKANPEIDGTNSDTFILMSFAKQTIIIGGTEYAGENKKSIFGVLNFLLPAKNIMPMHCSANVGNNGDTALFFGLSGTGKTTLSADPNRKLIGDDEHGWTDRGIFNFEGGCYAKIINLNPEAEPAIYRTTHTFGTVLENVVLDENRKPDLNDGSLTENTRSAYPIEQIDNIQPNSIGDHPKNIIFLTADAFGVLPPVSRLENVQMEYQFISGFTSKIPGTEQGVAEPIPTFSTCFGAPFMPLHPAEYASLLSKKVSKHKSKVWLVNTGWSGGKYGTGARMSIAHTRAIITAIVENKLGDEYTTEPYFGLKIPKELKGVPSSILNPRESWTDKGLYDETAKRLNAMFRENFKRFESQTRQEVIDCMPVLE